MISGHVGQSAICEYAILQHQIQLAPATVTVDFEIGLMAAILDEFPATILHGCYFHFTQAIWRKVQFFGLVQQYKDNDEVMTVCRQLMAQPFIPVADLN